MKERDRRWGLVRNMMKENEVEALMVAPGNPMDDPSVYLTNSGQNLLFFPLEGEPILFGRAIGLFIDSLMKSEDYGIESWVKDWRFPREGVPAEWVKILQERDLIGSRIGTLARSHFSGKQQQGMVSGLTNFINKTLPGVTFADVYDPFLEILMAKSDEEIAMFRKAALAEEVLTEAYVHACKPGNTLADVQAAAMAAVLPYGVNFMCPEIGSGFDGGRGIWWRENGMAPPVIKKGDLLFSEIFGWVGPVHAQAQICVSVGEPSEEKKSWPAWPVRLMKSPWRPSARESHGVKS